MRGPHAADSDLHIRLPRQDRRPRHQCRSECLHQQEEAECAIVGLGGGGQERVSWDTAGLCAVCCSKRC